MDSHTAGIYGVLIAVVLVGVVGLYFTMNVPEDWTQVVYVSSGPTYSGAGLYQPIASSFAAAKPFFVKGKGITGLSIERFGTATITTNLTYDLRMPKPTITCEAEIDQDEDEVVFYTCSQNATGNSTIKCDDGSVTSNTTCSQTQNAGAFVVCNHGAPGNLTAMVLNITIGGVNSTNITLDNILYNATDNDPGKGCVGNCNLCPAPDTVNCFKDPLGITYPTNVSECKFFDTSGQCVCECFSIHITSTDDVHLLKSGETLEFVIKKTIEPTYLNSSSEC